MICVREPSEGDDVDGPFAVAVRFDMVAETGGGDVVVEVGDETRSLSHLDPDHRHRRASSTRPQKSAECSALVKSFVASNSLKNLEKGFWVP
jgi:hypothetical protein